MNLLSILSSMAFTIYMLIGIYGFNLNRKATLNKLFLALCTCFGTWAFAFIFIYPNYFGNTIWHWIIDKVGAFGWCTYYGVSFHLALVLTGKTKYIDRRWKRILIYLPGAALLLADMIAFAPGVIQTKNALNLFAYFSLVASTTYVLGTLALVFIWGKATKIGKEKKQSKVIVITGLISFLISLIFQSVFPILGLPTVFAAQIYCLIWTFGVFFAITKYKLMSLTASHAAMHILPKIKDMVILIDTNNFITYANNQVEMVLGYSIKNISRQHYSYIFSDCPKLSTEKQELICLGKKGERIPVSVVSDEVYDEEGDFLGTLIILSDIREAKKLHDEILERQLAENSLRNLLDNSGQGFLTFGNTLLIDKEYSAWCNVLFNKTVSGIPFPELLYNGRTKYRDFVNETLTKLFSTEDKEIQEKYIELLPHSIIVDENYIQLKYKVVYEQEEKKVMAIITDITKEINLEKKIEEILIKTEHSYNLLIQNSRDAIFVHRDGKMLFANDSAAKLLGLMSPEELNGKPILDFTATDVRTFINNKFDQIYKEKSTVMVFNGKVINAEGEIIDVENISTYFVYEGKPTILSIVRDITSEKQVEQLKKDVEENVKLLNETREMNKIITDFFSNVSHELKTPLNVIFSAVQTLNLYNEGFDGHKIKREKYYHMIKQNCYRLMRLINNLLDMTRVDSGFIKATFKNYNIVNILENITLSVVEYVEDKGLSLTFDTEIEEKLMACDPDKIERIMLNLISNSVKFTGAGGNILVYVKEEGNSIFISIKDSGVGIPQDMLDIVFDRFGQVDKTFTRNREGSGIGLSLVKSFVEMHGGTIEVVSDLGKGSEFIINLPITLVEENYENEEVYEVNIERINIEFSDIYF